MTEEIVLIEIYQEGLNYIDRVIQNIPAKIINLNNVSSFSGAVYKFMSLLEGIEWLFNVLVKIEDIEGINFTEFMIDEKSVQEILDEFKGYTDNLLEAINEKDLDKLTDNITSSLELELTEMRKVYETLLIYYQNKCYIN